MSRFPSTLPHELWEDVFYWATFGEARAASCVHGPTGGNFFADNPFAHLYEAEIFANARKALAVKHALALVCSVWRSLSRRFLLEEIWIDGLGVDGLEDLLVREDDLEGKNFGTFVRCARIELWDTSSEPTFVTPRTGRILALCPGIRFLITWRCLDASPLPHQARRRKATYIAFQYLKMPKLVYAQLRGWENIPDHWIGITVSDFVVRSPYLHTLSLRSHLKWGTKIMEAKLRTLDYDCSSWPYLSRMDLDLPTLDRLILRTPLTSEGAGWHCVRSCATSIRCLEIGDNKGFLSQSVTNNLLHFLSTCPGLEAFYYPIPSIDCSLVDQAVWVENYRPPSPLPAVRTIGLHAGKEPILAEGVKLINDHLHWLSKKSRFSALEQIVMCGHEWQYLRGIPWLSEAMDRMEEAGISVQSDPGLRFV